MSKESDRIFNENPQHTGESNAAYIRRMASTFGGAFSTWERNFYFWKNGGESKVKGFKAKEVNAVPEIKKEVPEKKQPSIKRGMSLKEFQEKYDPLEIIRKGVTSLKKNEIITQAEFIHDLNLPGGVSYRDKLMLDEFEPYRGAVNASDIRWGHPDDIALLKSKRLLK